MTPTASFWSGKRALVTVHTGFKGACLSFWLTRLGAGVSGFALAPDQSYNLYDQLHLSDTLDQTIDDIRDLARLKEAFVACGPDVVFHLAAQSLVRESYTSPINTWSTNVMGTANLLSVAGELAKKPLAPVLVTTDKVYENLGWDFAYRETDQLGGHDPYSASKAATELLAASWQKSFFHEATTNVKLATARAGNVSGGGDWAADRLVPDIARALSCGESVKLRNPDAIRPWQHVLDPLAAYLQLGEWLYEGRLKYGTAYNFGPSEDTSASVRSLVESALTVWPGDVAFDNDPSAPHEAGKLTLSIAKARAELGWRPRWDFSTSVARTITWYRDFASGVEAKALCIADLDSFEQGGAA